MRKITRLALGLAIIAATATVPTASFAHAEVVSASPAPGSTIDAGETQIDIQFNEDLLQSEDSQGSEIEITDNATGDSLATACVYVEGSHLHAVADLYTNSEVTLTWRTVADDGHPISDSYTFTVSNPDNLVAMDGPTCVGGHPYAADPRVMKYNTAPTPTPTTKKSSDNGLLVGLGGGVLVIFVFAVLGALQTKRRWAKEDAAAKKKK